MTDTEQKEKSFREIMQSMAREIVKLCSLVDFWLNNQTDLTDRISKLEARIADLERK